MVKFNKIILFIIFCIIMFIIIEFVKLNTMNKCPKPVIQYRFVPRTFNEDQNDPIYVSEIFRNMFNEQSPWSIANNINNINKNKIL